MDINSYHKLKEYYDRAYLDYLRKTPSGIILTTLLSDVTNLMGEGKGVIIDPDTHDIMATVDNNPAARSKIDWLQFISFGSEIEVGHISRTVQSSIQAKLIRSLRYKNSTLISVPFIFCNAVNGIMILSYNENQMINDNIDSIESVFVPFQNMMGVLFYMIYDNTPIREVRSRSIPMPMPEEKQEAKAFQKEKSKSDAKSIFSRKSSDPLERIAENWTRLNLSDSDKTESPSFDIEMSTYQIMVDAVNSVCDAIVITDRDLRIIFKNEPAHRVLKSYYRDSYKSDNIVDIIPQTIAFMSNSDNDSYYRNKRITMDLPPVYSCDFNNRDGRNNNNQDACRDSRIEICTNSICSSGSLYHVMRLTVRNDEKAVTTKGKNLVAYLSHELRNPIQAITTGVYVLNKTLQSTYDKKISNIFSSFDSDESRSGSETQSSHDNLADSDREMFDHQSNTDSDSESEHHHSHHSHNIHHSDLSLIAPHVQIAKEVLNLSDSDSTDARIISSKRYVKNEQYHQLDPESVKLLQGVMKRVDSSCKNMKIIIDDILDLSKLDNDEMIMNMDEYDIVEILQVIADEHHEMAEAKGLEFICTIDTEVPTSLYTDETRVYQVLSNLVSNSIKYSHSGTVGLSVYYDSKLNNVCFEIKDEGKGIRKSEMNNLFKDFGTTTNSTPGISSNGLGLCVCQKIATLLGGSIEVKSEYRKGSTFTFVHPIKLNYSGSSIGSMNLTDSEIQDTLLRYVKGDILIVDDDENITSLFKLLLKWINYDYGSDLKIDVAKDGERAVRYSYRKKYDLIFMDIDLDGEDGCSICDTITANGKNVRTPVIAVTANIKSIQKDRDVRYDCFRDVLLKPFTNKDINHIIAKYI